jgi:hypothetical protein
MTLKKPSLPPRPGMGRVTAPPRPNTLQRQAQVGPPPDSRTLPSMPLDSQRTEEITSPFVDAPDHTLVDGASHLQDDEISDASDLFMPQAKRPQRTAAPPAIRARFETADSFEPPEMSTAEDEIWRPNSDLPPGSLPSAPWAALPPPSAVPSSHSLDLQLQRPSRTRPLLLVAVGVVMFALLASIAFLWARR